jgi:hypothetical protein
MRETSARLDPAEGNHLVSIHMFHNLGADPYGWIGGGLVEAGVEVEHMCSYRLWRGPNHGRRSPEQNVGRLVELCLRVRDRC